jgi:hypothetical protein
MSRLDRKKFGFWYTIGEQNKLRLVGLEGLIALALGTGGSLALIRWTSLAQRTAIASDFLTFVSALLGIVLAGFALVVAFLSDSYTLQLQRNPRGVRAFFAPFMINIGIDVGFVIGTITYRAAAPFLPHAVEKTLFVVLCTCFIYTALNITALARAVMAHGVTRAELISMDHREKELHESSGGQSRPNGHTLPGGCDS